MAIHNKFTETIIEDAAPGRTVVGTGTADWDPPDQVIAFEIKLFCLLTSVYTPGKFGRAHPNPNETTPANSPLQNKPPPESPWLKNTNL